MKLAVLSRHRRLLVLCACSAVAHLAVLEVLAARRAGPFGPVPAQATSDLSIRLVPTGRTNSAAAPVAARPAVTPSPPRARPVPAAVSHPPPKAPSARAATPVQPVAGPPAAEPATEAGPPLMQMPGRYRVRLPAPALLTYDVVRQPAGGTPVPVGTAQLSWRTDGDRYLLDMDGALGNLHSEGASGDAGIVPRRAREDTDAGQLVTEFDADGHRVVFHAAGTDGPDNVGMQDRASVLLQLAGIGLAEPDQLRDTVDVVVAGARDQRIARFRVLGQETVATGVGAVAALHLAELAAPGVARLDVWLAPERGWLPVRLRVEDSGASITQTLSAAGPAPDLPAGPP